MSTDPAPGWAARAWGLQALCYLLAFGLPSVAAICLLVGVQPAPSGLYGVVLLAGFALAPLGLYAAHRWLGLSADSLGLRGGHLFPLGALGATGLSYLMMWLGFQVLHLFPQWAEQSESQPLWDLAASLHGGIVEELLLLALPVAISARLGWPLWAQLLLVFALRVPFHLYYGPAALLLCLVWMTGVLFVYRKIWLVWPAVVAHLVFNLAHYPAIPPMLRLTASVALLLLGLGAAGLLLARRTPVT
ncbi:hypothetical protein GCM10010174_82390 [Kutzneria viridogrisea]|uniref:Abortive infection protein n=2 Tax=Kutzneria TaxID=43356 RepID=W5WHD1_9PSEU|nr:hypothetical protein [Kutzneria albida]AHI00126.1 hypothetical protein KALB_6767 [Kutzneria albida DSM 43870]MBA8925305.1 hypothetical protein [Kutzneria viridogrisea]